MKEGEESMKLFHRVDISEEILGSIRIQEMLGDANRKLVRVLTRDYEMNHRILLYHDDVSQDIESIVR